MKKPAILQVYIIFLAFIIIIIRYIDNILTTNKTINKAIKIVLILYLKETSIRKVIKINKQIILNAIKIFILLSPISSRYIIDYNNCLILTFLSCIYFN